MATIDSTAPRDVREHRQDERGKATAIWVLYLVALFTGLALIVGVVLAYLFRDDAPDWLRSHYDRQIGTFWWGVVWALTATALITVGVPLSVVLIGIPMVVLGGVIAAASWLWVLIRSVQGLKRVTEGRPF